MGMQWKYAIVAVFFCLPVLCLQSARADLIPVTVALEDDGMDSPANLAAISTLESLIDPGGGANWTTQANNALLGNILNLVMTVGGDSAEIAELFQPGAIFADVLEPTLPLVSTSALAQSSETPVAVPEPATMGFLGGALLFLRSLLSLYAMRPLRNINLHGPLFRSD